MVPIEQGAQATMIELTKTLLKKAVASIKAEPEKWDQKDWIMSLDRPGWTLSRAEEIEEITNPSCGTTLCLAGWMSHHLDNKDAFVSHLTHEDDVGTALLKVLRSAGESKTVLESLGKLFFILYPDSLDDFLQEAEAALGVSL